MKLLPLGIRPFPPPSAPPVGPNSSLQQLYILKEKFTCFLLSILLLYPTMHPEYSAQMGPRSKYREPSSLLWSPIRRVLPNSTPQQSNPYYPIINNYTTVLRQITWQMILWASSFINTCLLNLLCICALREIKICICICICICYSFSKSTPR
jgi:hypothetical protein